MLNLAFLEPIAYDRSKGIRTPKTTLPFKALGNFGMENLEMAHPRGFEPLASAFGGQRSIQLSYGCVVVGIISQTEIRKFKPNTHLFLAIKLRQRADRSHHLPQRYSV